MQVPGSNASDSNVTGPWWGPGIGILASFPGDLMQVGKGPHFEKHGASRTQGIGFSDVLAIPGG